VFLICNDIRKWLCSSNSLPLDICGVRSRIPIKGSISLLEKEIQETLDAQSLFPQLVFLGFESHLGGFEQPDENQIDVLFTNSDIDQTSQLRITWSLYENLSTLKDLTVWGGLLPGQDSPICAAAKGWWTLNPDLILKTRSRFSALNNYTSATWKETIGSCIG